MSRNCSYEIETQPSRSVSTSMKLQFESSQEHKIRLFAENLMTALLTCEKKKEGEPYAFVRLRTLTQHRTKRSGGQ